MPGKLIISCEFCSAPMRVYPSQVARKRFCSDACKYAALRTKVRKSCEVCSTPILAYPSQMARKRFCSRACQNRALQKARNPEARGELKVDERGYRLRYTPDHPHADEKGYVREHRLVAEEREGRYLKREEVVHHNDGNPANNHPDNLRIMSQGQHMSLHTSGAGNWNAKLSEASVREIRARARGGACQRALAGEFGVTEQTISKIVLRLIWRHIE